MIQYLIGEITVKELDSIAIEVGGVGYGVRVSLSDYEQLTQGDHVKLFIYEHIREDSYDLFGFITQASKVLFNQLLSVKNVGPKVALAVLSIGPENVVRAAIASGDVKKLQSAKGVGKRAAEQMVVELRDKVGLMASFEAEELVTRGAVDSNDEAIQALVALGYTEADAQRSLNAIDKNLPTEERIKLALKV